MKAYIVISGVMFGLITAAHVLRMLAESSRFIQEPTYVGLTVLSGGLFFWAIYLVSRAKK